MNKYYQTLNTIIAIFVSLVGFIVVIFLMAEEG